MGKIPSFVWLLIGELIVGAILIACGFKFTYAPELENSWGAISAFAAWASVIASSIAIFVAIRIPKQISDQQNKIALFEKRYEAYHQIEMLHEFCSEIEKLAPNIDETAQTLKNYVSKRELICTYWESIMGEKVSVIGQNPRARGEIISLVYFISANQQKALSLSNLIPMAKEEKEKMRKSICEIYDLTKSFMCNVVIHPLSSDIDDTDRITLIENVNQFFDGNRELFEDYISFTK